MKTFPPEQEYHDIRTNKDSTTEETISTGNSFRAEERNYHCYAKNNVTNDYPNSSESDTLIVCSPGLASSFQTLKSDKQKLSPGHYLHRVLITSVTQKFRSQSLPNCCEKRKHGKGTKEDDTGNEDLNETSVPLVQSVVLDSKLSSCVDAKDCATEGWFKTWPERSIDKISNLTGDSHCDCSKPTRVESVNSEQQTCIKDHYDISYKNDKSFIGLNSDNLVSPDNQCTYQKLQEESQFNNSHNSHYPIKVSEKLAENSSSFDNGRSLNVCGPFIKDNSINKSVRLDELLDSFPLAYSPVTKQLLLVKSNTQQVGNFIHCNSDKSYDEYSESIQRDEKSNLEGIVSDVEVKGGAKDCTSESKSLECDLPLKSLHRVNTEISSFSSTVSSLSDISPSTIEDSALGSLLDHGDTCSLVSVGGCSDFSEDSVGAGSKKKSLSGFFSRNVFNWKSVSRSEDSFGRWKLFGKNPSPLSSHSSLAVDNYAESDRGSLAPDSPCSVRSSDSAARLETKVASSSALIQLDRPANLPAKSEEEQARHRAQYQQILEAAKKKEIKEAKLRKKQHQMQLKAEEQLAQAIRVWTQEIIPKWGQMHSSKKARDLWWQGVPPCVRGKVWKLAIGNSLHLTHALYNIYVQRAQERLRGGGPCSEDDKEASMELIQLDISRTFPHLCIFQRGGPYYDMLHCLLAAYVCYRPDVGYVQGMSFIAAVLILNMEAADAFVCFANLLDRPCHRAFYLLDQPRMQAYYSTYDQLFRENLPQLYAHFTDTTLTPDLYLLDWIYTVFTKTMNLDLSCRVWDVSLRDGEEFLFRTALGVLHLCQDMLLQMDFVRGSQFLTRLPDDLPADQLFKSISCIRMAAAKLTFQDILALHSADLDNQ